MVRDILRLDLAVIPVSKHLNRVEKISNCGVNSANPRFLSHPHPLLSAGVPATPQNSPTVTSND